MHAFVSRMLKLLVLGAVLTALFACSGDDVNQPVELEPLKPKIKVERVWKTSVGSGDEDYQLALTPSIREDIIYTLDRDGDLYALDRFNGDKKWERSLDERISGAITADRDHLYYATFQGELVCLDRTSGNEIWRRPLSSEVISQPSSNNRTVVVQTIDGKLFAFDATEGVQKWRHDSVGPILSIRGTPAPLILRDRVITTFANGEMFAFDLQDGRPLWKSTVGTPKGRTELERLVDADGNVYLEGDRLYAAAYQGNMISVDVTTGRQIWSRQASSFNGVALGQSRVYATLSDGDVLAVNQFNSNEIWRNTKLKYRRLSSPVTFGNTLVLSDLEGYIHFISQDNGEFLARIKPDSDGTMGNMLVRDELLYVYTRSGYLFAYRIKS